MSWFMIGVMLLLLALFGLRLLANADPGSLAKTGKWVFLTLFGLLLLFLLIRGGVGFLWLILFGLLPWIGRLRQAGNIWKTLRGSRAGQYSEVKSDYLHMRLNQENGDMEGYVTQGRFEGRYLNQMDLAECLEMMAEIRGDPKSVQLLGAYLDKTYGADWRAQDEKAEAETGGGASSAPGGPMTRAEALRVLGLEEGATAEEIRRAHRNLMKQMHPDHGGSDYLAAKINEAKEVLLGN